MKKTTLFASALILSVGATHAQAQVRLKGSDTLEAITKQVIAACGVNIVYDGTGSSNGESAMVTGTQQVAPMSRKVKCSVAGAKKEGKVLGYDGIAMVRSQCTYQNGDCQTFASSDACETLRVLYFGISNGGAANCNSAARQALVNGWDTLFQGAQAESCTQLRHAFRRDDQSGTTDTLRTVCNVPSSALFCNGAANSTTSTYEDNDPIRRPSPTGQYDIAGRASDGTLGVVLPIAVPANAASYSPGTPAANGCGVGTAGTTRCATGAFRYREYPGSSTSRCPDGTKRKGGLCRIPLASSGGSPQCVNAASNIPGGAVDFDGRVYNNYPRDSSGLTLPGQDGVNYRAFYRMHETRAFFGNGCKEADATRQIGCLAAANGCSEGFAGRETLAGPGTRRVQLVSPQGVCVDPTPANILSSTYPLSRKLYFSTLKGFASVTGDEATLSACMSDETKVEPAVSANGFVVDPASGIQVEQFGAGNCAP